MVYLSPPESDDPLVAEMEDDEFEDDDVTCRRMREVEESIAERDAIE